MSLDRYLFRGIPLNDKKWVYGNLIHIESQPFIFDGALHENYRLLKTPDDRTIITPDGVETPTYYERVYFPSLAPVVQETVGQWTGCFDREDSQIFEGDLIKNKQGEIGRVYLHGTGFRVSTEISPAGFDALWWMQLHKYNPPSPKDDPTPNCDISIIGSIHDHLLGEKQ